MKDNRSCSNETQPVHPCEPAPRIQPLPTSGMRAEWLATLARIPGDGLKGAGFPHSVLGAIMHNPDTFGPFLEFWVTAKSKMALSVREQELVILRMACLYRSNYVWKHHVPVGREFGLRDAELAAVLRGTYGGVFPAREHALLALTDELVDSRTIRPETWARHGGALPAKDVVDLISLVAQYVFFALVNNSLQVQVEPAVDGVPGLEAGWGM